MVRRDSLRNAFRRAMLNDPDGSRKDAFARFLEIVQSDPKYLVDLATEYFDREAAEWKIERVGKSVQLVGTAKVQRRAELSAERRSEIIAENARAVKERMAQIRKGVLKSIISLDFIMWNGKRLRECTFAEVRKWGGIFTELARHGKGNEVIGSKINAKDLENIVSRFDTPARRRSAPSAGYEARL